MVLEREHFPNTFQILPRCLPQKWPLLNASVTKISNNMWILFYPREKHHCFSQGKISSTDPSSGQQVNRIHLSTQQPGPPLPSELCQIRTKPAVSEIWSSIWHLIFHLLLSQFSRGLGLEDSGKVTRDPLGDERMLIWTTNGIVVTQFQNKKSPKAMSNLNLVVREDPKKLPSSIKGGSVSRNLWYSQEFLIGGHEV